MRSLIVYYSFSGNNRYLAKKLEEQLHCEICEIKEGTKRTNFTILLDLLFSRSPEIQKSDVDLSDYDRVIFIAPVWGGKIASPLRSFIQKKKKNLKEYCFITLCSGLAHQKQKIKIALEKLVGRPPLAIEELWVNDLLSPEKKNKIKYTTPYRIKSEDFQFFRTKIESFLATAVKKPMKEAKSMANRRSSMQYSRN